MTSYDAPLSASHVNDYCSNYHKCKRLYNEAGVSCIYCVSAAHDDYLIVPGSDTLTLNEQQGNYRHYTAGGPAAVQLQKVTTVITPVEALLHYHHYTGGGPAALPALHRLRPCCITVITPVEALLHYCYYTGRGPAVAQLKNDTLTLNEQQGNYCHYTAGGLDLTH